MCEDGPSATYRNSAFSPTKDLHSWQLSQGIILALGTVKNTLGVLLLALSATFTALASIAVHKGRMGSPPEYKSASPSMAGNWEAEHSTPAENRQSTALDSNAGEALGNHLRVVLKEKDEAVEERCEMVL